jgi:hypothetical protein
MSTLVISYSRKDRPQVQGVVALLQTAMRDVERAVYWDGQLDPGEEWFEQLKAHIDSAEQLFVFWCDHSSTSTEVRREFTYAFQKNKRVVPVLLDDTPLVQELAPIQGIDLRGAVRHSRASWFTVRRVAVLLAFVALAPVLALFLIPYPWSAPASETRVQPILGTTITTPTPDSATDLGPDVRRQLDQWVEQLPRASRGVLELTSAPGFDHSADLAAAYLETKQSLRVLFRQKGDMNGLDVRLVLPPAAPPSPGRRDLVIRTLVRGIPLALVALVSLWQFFVWKSRKRRRKLIVREFSEYFVPK